MMILVIHTLKVYCKALFFIFWLVRQADPDAACLVNKPSYYVKRVYLSLRQWLARKRIAYPN